MMKEIKCTIIQDILPLYIDGVVGQDTKEMVEEHLKQCERCKEECEAMKREIYLPIENKAPILKSIKKKWRNKKIIISGVSVLLTASLLFGIFGYIFHYDTVIPYSEDLIKIETQNDNQLVSHFYGISYSSVNLTHPMKMKIEGQEKNVSFLHYTETIADSPSRKLINNNPERKEEEFIFTLPESELVDAVYYVDWDIEKMAEEGNEWSSLLDNAVLIWEK